MLAPRRGRPVDLNVPLVRVISVSSFDIVSLSRFPESAFSAAVLGVLCDLGLCFSVTSPK